jgi:hypothetical protein
MLLRSVAERKGGPFGDAVVVLPLTRETTELLKFVDGNSSRRYCRWVVLALSPDGKWLASGTIEPFKVWNLDK